MRTIRYTKEMSKIITIQMRNIRLGGKCHSILTKFQNNFLNKMDLLYSQARIWMWVWDILVLGTLGPWNPWTLEPLVLGTPPISSSYSSPWVWFGYGVRGGVSCDIGEWDWRWTFILILKSWTSSFLLHSLPLTSSHLLLIPPSYSTLLPNLLLTPPTSYWRVPDD